MKGKSNQEALEKFNAKTQRREEEKGKRKFTAESPRRDHRDGLGAFK